MSANEGDTNTRVMDCLAAGLLLGLDEFGNLNCLQVFWLRAAAVVRNDTEY